MRVPVYQRQESLRAPRTPSVPSPRPSGLQEVARGIQDVGEGLNKVDERLTEIRVTEALNTFEERVRPVLYDPKTGILNQEGSTVLESGQAAYKQLEDLRRDTVDGLSTPWAKARATEKINQRLLQYKRSIEQHTGRQINIARGKALSNAETNAVNEVSAGAYASLEAFEDILNRVDEDQQKLSNSLEEYQERREKFRRSAMLTALDHLLRDKNVEGARALLNKYREEMGPQAHALEQRVRAEEEKQEAAIWAAGEVFKHTDLTDERDPWVDTVALRDARQGLPLDSERRKALDAEIASAEERQKAKTKVIADQAWGQFASGGFRTSAIPEPTRAWLEKRAGREWAAIVKLESQKRKERQQSAYMASQERRMKLNEAQTAFRDLDLSEQADVDPRAFAAQFGLNDPESINTVQSWTLKSKGIRDKGETQTLEQAATEFVNRVMPNVRGTESERNAIAKDLRRVYLNHAVEIKTDDQGRYRTEDLRALGNRLALQEGSGKARLARARTILRLAQETGLPDVEVSRALDRIIETAAATGRTVNPSDVTAKQIRREIEGEGPSFFSRFAVEVPPEIRAQFEGQQARERSFSSPPPPPPPEIPPDATVPAPPPLPQARSVQEFLQMETDRIIQEGRVMDDAAKREILERARQAGWL